REQLIDSHGWTRGPGNEWWQDKAHEDSVRCQGVSHHNVRRRTLTKFAYACT
ncbi:hypothetical protein LSAT2_022743, partial [Lamellibrachia satsuma]